MDNTSSSNNYKKNYFTPTNIAIYLIVAAILYGAVYFLFLSKKNTTSPYNSPSPTSAVMKETPTTAVMMTSAATLDQQNASGETGTVTMTEKDGKTTVELVMTGAPAGSVQPAHIHKGACPTVGAVAYPLTDIVNGKSTTVLNVDLATLKQGMPLAINVHKSAAQINAYVACGDLNIK